MEQSEEKAKKRRKRKDGGAGKEHKANWKEYMATVEDIQNFLMDRILLRHNVITRRVEYRIPQSYDQEDTDWQPINDRIVNSLWTELSAQKVVRAQDISANRLGLAFKSQGFEYMRTMYSRGYIVMQRDAGDIKARLKMLATEEVSSSLGP